MRGHLRGRQLFSLRGLQPRIAVRVGDNLEGNIFNVFLDLLVGEFSSYQPLGCVKGVFRIGDCLSLGCAAHEDPTVVLERDDRGGGPFSFGVLDDNRDIVFCYRNARVCSSEVDSNYI